MKINYLPVIVKTTHTETRPGMQILALPSACCVTFLTSLCFPFLGGTMRLMVIHMQRVLGGLNQLIQGKCLAQGRTQCSN